MESAQLYKLSVTPVSSEPACEAPEVSHTRNQPEYDARKRTIREHFDLYAGERPWWEKKAAAYIEDQIRYFRFLIPEGLRVLEIGSGLGTLLAAVKPARGVGIDLSPEMVTEAARRHPTLEFRVGDAESLELYETFDVIILSDLIGHLVDVQAAFSRLRQACTPHTRIIVSSYNFLWEPLLRLGEHIGMKMPQPEQSWFSPADIIQLLSLADFDTVKAEQRLLMPKRIPLLSSLCNNLLAYVPGFRRLCLSHYIVARPRLRIPERPYSTTIVVPCHSSRENKDGLFFTGYI
ncbi:MAG: methyltransferase domain-containing protein [Nitrospira sp.]